MVDYGDYEVIGLGNVLVEGRSLATLWADVEEGENTLPLLFSTHIAFFFWSMKREPPMVEEMVEGSTCRRPGPSLSGRDEFEGIGKRSGDITSPGRTIVSVAISRCFSLLRRQSPTINPLLTRDDSGSGSNRR